MKYGYARVSTDDQGPALQLAALKKAGCRQTFTDHGLSGATTKRPALARCLKALQPGKTLNPERINCCRGQMQRLVRPRLGVIRTVAACPQDSRPRMGVFIALAARTGSKYSRRNAILSPAARRKNT